MEIDWDSPRVNGQPGLKQHKLAPDATLAKVIIRDTTSTAAVLKTYVCLILFRECPKHSWKCTDSLGRLKKIKAN